MTLCFAAFWAILYAYRLRVVRAIYMQRNAFSTLDEMKKRHASGLIVTIVCSHATLLTCVNALFFGRTPPCDAER